MELIKNYFKGKTVAFYIAFATAVISVVTAIIYAAVFGGMQEYMSWFGFVLMLLAAVAFIVPSLFGYAKLGVAAMALLDFAAMVVSLLVTYNYFVAFAIGGGISAVFADGPAVIFIVCLVLLMVCCIAANVAAWLRVQKKQKSSVADLGEKI